MGIQKKKISELQTADTLTGLYTIGTDARNESVKVGLEFVQTAAENASAAAESASEAAGQIEEFKEEISEQVTSKADLDSEKKYVTPVQLDPLWGLQTGVNTSEGYYSGSVPGLPQSIEMLFTTGPDVSAAQRVATYTGQSAGSYWNAALDIAGGGMVATYGVSAPSVPASSGTLYHVVMCKDYVQVNGVAYPLAGAPVPSAITGFRVGRTTSDATPRIFNGTVHHLRVFNYSLSGAEALALWNGGRPVEYRLPVSGPLRTGCVAEYLPTGLLPTGWRDTSGSGADLTASGAPAYSYQAAANYGPDFPLAVALENEFSYGIEWDTAVSSPACRRIGNMALHRELPVQSRMRGCLLSDQGEVVHYLDAANWTAETRDGTAGQVMVEIPAHYRRFETDGTLRRARISEIALPGFHYVPRCYISAYEATLERSSGKLCSVVNTGTDYRGGNNQADWDGTYRSLLGRPATSLSRTALRAAARKRQEGSAAWNCLDYGAYKAVFWLYYVEYANFNCQEEFNIQKNANGFAQGGLGEGVTTLEYAAWSSFNNTCPFVPCGHTDALGNGSGEVAYVVSGAEGTTLVTVYVPRYRGIENPFGHIWQWVDGINVEVKAEADGGASQVYVASDPALYGDGEEDGYALRGEEARASGFVRELIFGPDGEIMPSAVGGGSTTYFCDYHYTGIPAATTLRGVMLGGYAMRGANNGLASSNTSYVPSYASADVGTRLCYIPQPQNRQDNEQSVL